MKIHHPPASTVSRPVMMFIQDNDLPVEFQAGHGVSAP